MPEQLDERIEFQILRLTGDRLREVVREFLVRDGSRRGAAQLLWFAGHGESISGEGLPLGTESPPRDGDPDELVMKAVQLREIGSWMRLARSQHVLAVFDSCFAGTVFEPRSEPRPREALSDMLSQPVRQFVTSGGAGEEVYDNGAFAERFLEAIQTGIADANRDDYVTATELGLYLALRTQRDSDFHQTPQYGELLDRDFDRGNFVFRVPEQDATRRAPVGLTVEAPAVPVYFRDCPDCPQMARVPASRSAPATDFEIGRFEITFEEWDACVADGACVALDDAVGDAAPVPWCASPRPRRRTMRAGSPERPGAPITCPAASNGFGPRVEVRRRKRRAHATASGSGRRWSPGAPCVAAVRPKILTARDPSEAWEPAPPIRLGCTTYMGTCGSGWTAARTHRTTPRPNRRPPRPRPATLAAAPS